MPIKLLEECGNEDPHEYESGERGLHADVEGEHAVVDLPAEVGVGEHEAGVGRVVGQQRVAVELAAQLGQNIEQPGQRRLRHTHDDQAGHLEQVRQSGTQHHHHDVQEED